jgi:dihydroorotate dehydrogenase electron transfer subunit
LTKYFPAEIISNIRINESFHLLTIAPLSENTQPRAGQFYMLQAGFGSDPLLKRPFSIYDFDERGLQFLFRIRGRGTSYLSAIHASEVIHAIGPLGNGYPPPDGLFIAIAGGIGIASIMGLLKQFQNKAFLFYGARAKSELVMLDEALVLSKEVCISTNDGSIGHLGLVTELFKDFIESNPGLKTLPVYCCGSPPMLNAIQSIVERYNLNCYASIEERMACGIGACLSCAAKVKNEKDNDFSYKRVCKEGPVFNLSDIIWE